MFLKKSGVPQICMDSRAGQCCKGEQGIWSRGEEGGLCGSHLAERMMTRASSSLASSSSDVTFLVPGSN